MGRYEKSFLELIRKTSTELSGDVLSAIQNAYTSEDENSPAKETMKSVLENIQIAKDKSLPICQDTGTVNIYMNLPKSLNPDEIRKDAMGAVKLATRKGLLRENLMEPISGGELTGNVGSGSPVFDIQFHEADYIDARLILKGGGCENVSAQLSLPNDKLNANRDEDGIIKCALETVFQAQGKGCAPGVLGICVGGDRAAGFAFAKKQFLRKLGERNPDDTLAALEKKILDTANTLGIGPMGLGGKNTVLGCLIGTLGRIPASFYVTVSYMCWAFRRNGVRLGKDGGILEWLY